MLQDCEDLFYSVKAKALKKVKSAFNEKFTLNLANVVDVCVYF